MVQKFPEIAAYKSITELEADLDALILEWQGYFESPETVDTSPDEVREWVDVMRGLCSGTPSCHQELALLKLASDNPMLGLMLVLAGLVAIGARGVRQIWELNFLEEGGFAGGWNFKDLPAPGAGVKYLIFSDLHRDDAIRDDLGLFKSGSIDHFKANQRLYEKILDFADTKGYTVIEAGDCEELWFVRSVADYPKAQDGGLDIRKKLEQIVESHPGVYSRLKKLNEAGRYYRIYGNHDSFLKPGCGDLIQVLRTALGNTPSGPLEIYDAFLIPGLKSMLEATNFEIVTDVFKVVAGLLSFSDFVKRLLKGRLGMNSNDYARDTRMVVTHGHQFDFWNKPENEFLGLMIANTVGMFVDRNMDPFLDIRGIAVQGNPWIDFADAFAGWPVFNSWVSRAPSLRFAHQVQHMPNSQRGLTDTIMFSESWAALWGTLGIALNHVEPDGTIITPAQSRASLNLLSITGLTTYLTRHHLHHICIGHTHNPHSQPYATLTDLGAIVPPLAPLFLLADVLLPIPSVKTTYFNSGTGGWMEGVIWAIEIDETGQARVVFWTDRGDPNAAPDPTSGEEPYSIWGPEYMDWELQPLPPSYQGKNLLEELAMALGIDPDEISEDLNEILELIRQRMEELNVAAADISAALARAVVMPIHVLAAGILRAPTEFRNKLRQLQEIPKSLPFNLEDLKNQFGLLREFNFDVFLTVKRYAYTGFDSGEESETLTIKAPISSAMRERLERFKRVLVMMGSDEDTALHYAGVAVSMFDQFPGNVPFFSGLSQTMDPLGPLQATESPVLHSLLSSLWMYPAAGQVVEVMGVRITSTFELSPTEVSLTVVIGMATEEPPETEPQDEPEDEPADEGGEPVA